MACRVLVDVIIYVQLTCLYRRTHIPGNSIPKENNCVFVSFSKGQSFLEEFVSVRSIAATAHIAFHLFTSYTSYSGATVNLSWQVNPTSYVYEDTVNTISGYMFNNSGPSVVDVLFAERKHRGNTFTNIAYYQTHAKYIYVIYYSC